MPQIDYTAAAELYPSKRFHRVSQVRYRRFDSVAEAVRYAVEDMPAEWLRGSLLEVDEQRFEGAQIKTLYLADGYPLTRRSAS